jgi:hypothetical protein
VRPLACSDLEGVEDRPGELEELTVAAPTGEAADDAVQARRLKGPDRHEKRLSRAALLTMEQARRGNFAIHGGTEFSRHSAIYMRGARCESLIERYPTIPDATPESAVSHELASMPAIRFPAPLHAALATGSPRKPRPSDLHDIVHLTNGLGRCDIVTCDSSMAQVCRERQLVPHDVKLFSARELDALESELRTI